LPLEVTLAADLVEEAVEHGSRIDDHVHELVEPAARGRRVMRARDGSHVHRGPFG
jgi:hypothetical protein